MKTAIKTKLVDRFFFEKIFSSLIDQCTIKSPNFASIKNFYTETNVANYAGVEEQR